MKLEQLTFTRFLAAIAIVIYHFGVKIYPFNLKTISFLFKNANIGVSYFFILSGFVMIIAYGSKVKIDFIDYIQKRFARLYPAYGLAIILMLSYIIVSPTNHVNYKELLLNLTLTQSWFPAKATSFNYPGWSLSTEFLFYLLFPLLFNQFYKKFSLRTIITPILLFFVISQILFHYLINSSFYEGFPSFSYNFLFYFPLLHLNQFLLGNLAGIFFLNKKFRQRNYDLVIISLIIIISLLLKFEFGIIYHNGMMSFLFIPIIIFISINNGVISKIAKNKLFVFLGEISYGIYILQVPVFICCNIIFKIKYLHFINNPQIIFGISLATLILISGISYKYIEVPLREKINNVKIDGIFVRQTN